MPIFAQMTESIATAASPHAFTLAVFNPVVTNLLVGALLIICIVMILLVLIQRPQGGGLSGAFGSSGGSGAGQTAFGTKTGDVLTWATIGIFVCFIVFAIVLNFATRPPKPTSIMHTATSSSAPASDAPGNDDTEQSSDAQNEDTNLSGNPEDLANDVIDGAADSTGDQPTDLPAETPAETPNDVPTPGEG